MGVPVSDGPGRGEEFGGAGGGAGASVGEDADAFETSGRGECGIGLIGGRCVDYLILCPGLGESVVVVAVTVVVVVVRLIFGGNAGCTRFLPRFFSRPVVVLSRVFSSQGHEWPAVLSG